MASVSDYKAKKEGPLCGMTEETESSLGETKSVLLWPWNLGRETKRYPGNMA